MTGDPAPRRTAPIAGPPRASAAQRALAIAFAAVIALVLGTGASLAPAVEGMGTHKQLGLPSCGWIASSNTPCPTCGMTTAFTHLAHGNPLGALRAQPMGALGALLAAATFWGCLHVALTGTRIAPPALRLLSPRVMWIIGGLWAASWIYKIILTR